MKRLITLYQSTLGKKLIVAVSGLAMLGFVIGHMLGNLKAFTGFEADGTHHLDTYAHFLRTVGEPVLPYGTALWVARIGLLVALVVHVITIISLARINSAARPVDYARRTNRQATFSSRSMMYTGLLILGFVIIHVMHFTTGTIAPTPIVHGEVYHNIYHAFNQWFIVLFYVFAVALVGVHLYHGAWSLFQTVGWDNPDRNRGLRMLAAAIAVGVFLGFCAVPAFIFLGVLPAEASAATVSADDAAVFHFAISGDH